MTETPSTPEENEPGPRRARDVGFGDSGEVRTGPADLLDSDLDDLPTLPRPPIHVDPSTAQPARVGDYLVGGTANFSGDRAAIDYLLEVLPGGIETARDTLLAMRAFQRRAVRHLVGTQGVRQMLVAQPGFPDDEPIHEVARAATPGVRVIYVITDDNVMAQAHRLKVSTPELVSDYVRCRFDDPERLLRQAQQTLDLDQPVLASFNLAVIPDDDVVEHIVGMLRHSMCPGSHLMATSHSDEITDERLAEALARLDELAEQSRMFPVRYRPRTWFAGLLEGFELLEPGIVPLDEWRPDGDASPRSGADIPMLIEAAVGRKPASG